MTYLIEAAHSIIRCNQFLKKNRRNHLEHVSSLIITHAIMKKYTFIIPLLLLLNSCDSNVDTQDIETISKIESVIFGEIYGECIGDCREIFLLNNTGIYKDNDENEMFGDWENVFSGSNPLADETYQRARILLDVPDEILDESFEMRTPESEIADFDYYVQIITDNNLIRTFTFDEVIEEDIIVKEYFDSVLDINASLR